MSFQRVEDVLKKYFTTLAFSKHWFLVLVNVEISGWEIIAFGNISMKTFWRMCFSCFYEPMHNLFHVNKVSWRRGTSQSYGAPNVHLGEPLETPQPCFHFLSTIIYHLETSILLEQIISESGKNQKFWWLKYPQSNVDTRQTNNTKTLSSCLILINIWKLSFLFLLGLQWFLSPISLLPGPNFYPLICS